MVIFFGRLFFPKVIEDSVISPVRRMPVFGQILGTTWDNVGNIGPSINNKATEVADFVENNDLNIDSTVSNIINDDDPKQVIDQIIEQKINQSVDNLQNLPNNVSKSLEIKIKKEIYNQLCSGLEYDINSDSEHENNQ